jgi:hypothetical protein
MAQDDAGAVLAVFNRFFENIRSRRASENLALYSGDEDCDLIGSNKGEEGYGMEGLKAFFVSGDARPQGFDFKWASTRCTVAENTSWVIAHGSVSVIGGGAEGAIPFLLTCIFVRRNGSWMIRHFHGSEPR